MDWAFLGYAILLAFAFAEAWLICSVLVSGLINRFKTKDLAFLRYFGASTHIVTDKEKSDWHDSDHTRDLDGFAFSPGTAHRRCCSRLWPRRNRYADQPFICRAAYHQGRRHQPLFHGSDAGCDDYFPPWPRSFSAFTSRRTDWHSDWIKPSRRKSIEWLRLPGKSRVTGRLQRRGISLLISSLRISMVRNGNFQIILGEKPVFLFFGANSCPPFSHGTLGINKLQEAYGDQVEFVGVYVNEPHPVDGWWLAGSKIQQHLYRRSGSRAAIDIVQPTTQAQRNQYARRAHENLLNEGIPLLVDSMDNKVNDMYTGQPTRIYLLDRDGRVVYNQGIGPYSFNPMYAESVIQKHLADTHL